MGVEMDALWKVYNTPSNTSHPQIEHLRESSVKLIERVCSNCGNTVSVSILCSKNPFLRDVCLFVCLFLFV